MLQKWTFWCRPRSAPLVLAIATIALIAFPLLTDAHTGGLEVSTSNKSGAPVSSTEPSQRETSSVSNRSHVKARVLTADHSRADGTTEKTGGAELGIISSWTHSKTKDFMYTEGFMMRSLVVIFLCILVAMVLVFVRGLKDKQPKSYGALNSQMFSDQKAGQAGVRLILDEEDESEDDELFNSSQHKLLPKDRK